MNLLQAIHIIEKSWKRVTEQTIQNCFKHVGIVQDETFSFEEDTKINFEETIVSQHYHIHSLDAYLEVDDCLSTSEVITKDYIVSNICRNDLSDDSDEVDITKEVIQPTRESAASA